MGRTGLHVAVAVLLTAACGQVPERQADPAPTRPASTSISTTGSPTTAAVDIPPPDVVWRSGEQAQRCCLLGHGSAVLGDGRTVLVAGGFEGGQVTALDSATGERLWRAQLEGSTVFIGDLDDHVALVHGKYDWLAALDPTSGERRWRIQLDRDRYGVAGVELLGDTAVVSLTTPGEGDDRAPSVMLIDTTDGHTLWHTDLHEGSEMQWAAPLVVDGRVLVQTTPDSPLSPATNMLHTLGLDAGRLRWQTELGGRQGFFEAPPVVADGVVAARGTDLHGIDLDSGRVRWTTPGSYPLWARSDGSVVLSVRSELTAIRAHDGTHAATIGTSDRFDPASVPPVVDGDRVVLSTGRALLAFDRASAEPVWRYPTGTPPADLTSAGGHVVAVLQDGTVVALTGPDVTR